jgi:ubiquinone/menaquinone biosynthesis C-methylase UbiE
LNDPASSYVLGSTDAEHERLIWQAARVAPFTERLFREAGIGQGQRVLDLGSGVGDVTLQAARLVGSSGEVVGIERDRRSIARARARVAEAGLHNVIFVESDVFQIPDDKPFDAVVGRFILMWVHEPVSVLRSVSRLVRPGGVVAFHETYWAPTLALLAPLPLWSAVASLIHDTFRRSGANPDLGPALYQAFQEAGLPAPTMRLEMLLGKNPDFAQWFSDIIVTLRTQIQQFGLWPEALGDSETLQERLQAELATSNTVAARSAYVGAWCRKPKNEIPTISDMAEGMRADH